VRCRWFRLEGVSYAILPDEERDSVLAEWVSLLSNLREGVVLALRRASEYSYGGYSFPVQRLELYACGRVAGEVRWFGAREVAAPPRPRAVGLAGPRTLVLEDGTYARVLVAYRLPASLPEAFLYPVALEASEVALVFRLVPRARALSLVESARRRKAGGAGVEQVYEASVLQELATRVLAGADLFEVHLMVTLRARDPRELGKLESSVKALLKGFGVEAEAPPMQTALYSFGTCYGLACLERGYADAESLKPLFMLVEEELQDPEGVFVGVSGTGSPVLLDLWSRPNYNFVIVGVTGSGKSMAAKVYMKRLVERARLPIIGVDPESEYTRVASYFGASVLEVSEGMELGLDPIKLLQAGHLTLGEVADLLAEVYAIPEQLHGLLRKELFAKGDQVEDVEEFVATVQEPALKRYLEGATAPPDRYVYSGEPPRLTGSVVFGLRNVRSRRLKVLISALISAYAYSTLLTKVSRSVLFVDEAWMFMETPSIVGLFESVARRGRKHGVGFIYITQRAEDLARTPQGRTILEQSATVLLLRQEPEGRDAVRQIYRLSDAEAELLVAAPVGSGILKSGRRRLRVSILPTPEELEAFSTTPRGVT
jgi:hypothetical protein